MTTENNILIARFLGWKQGKEINKEKFPLEWFDESGNKTTSKFDVILSFHFDWNWLMPVVENIERYLYEEQATEFKIDIFSGASIYIPSTKTHIHYSYNDSSKIKAVYNAVIEFIKWYNENSADKN